MEYIRVILVDMPPSVRGFAVRVVENDGEFFSIIINSRLSDQAQIEAYDHEIRHINNHDYEMIYSADMIEAMNH